jgi:hypothetical protein
MTDQSHTPETTPRPTPRPIPPLEERRKIADEYCRKQLATMDGSAEAGIKRIGTERFDGLVKEIMRATWGKRGDR